MVTWLVLKFVIIANLKKQIDDLRLNGVNMVSSDKKESKVGFSENFHNDNMTSWIIVNKDVGGAEVKVVCMLTICGLNWSVSLI